MEKISILSEEMEKLSNRISEDLANFLVSYAGNLKDIETGTRIRIPMDVGYVSFYKSQNSSEISVWIKEALTQEVLPEEYNKDDET